jgi:hypothetical protein
MDLTLRGRDAPEENPGNRSGEVFETDQRGKK